MAQVQTTRTIPPKLSTMSKCLGTSLKYTNSRTFVVASIISVSNIAQEDKVKLLMIRAKWVSGACAISAVRLLRLLACPFNADCEGARRMALLKLISASVEIGKWGMMTATCSALALFRA